jgi:(p)ppGpp synthase/HD superfamily hydrolase
VEQEFDNFTKSGFARLLKHFEDNTDEVVKLTRAFALATKAHKGQLIGREPYVNHSLRTALIFADELQVRDADIASAALLHDALEGDIVHEKEVIEECGEKVAAIVRATSEPALKQKEGRDRILEEYFAKLGKASKEARCVRLADRLDTARAMKTYAYRDRALRFKEETQKHVVPLAQMTDERLAFKLSVALYEIK